MFDFFKKPFPLVEKVSQKLIFIFIASLFVFVFLMVFQPFQIAGIETKASFVLGFALVTAIVMLFGFFILPAIFKSFFDPEKWNIGKTFIFVVIHLFLISILNWYYTTLISYIFPYDLFSMIWMTLAVAVFPVSLFFFLSEKYIKSMNDVVAENYTEIIQKKVKPPVQSLISIESDGKNQNIDLHLDQLICIKSEGNYIGIYYTEKGKVIHELLRNTLGKVTKELEGFDCIIRCHRSYLINFNKVARVSGNARNFSLHIDEIDFSIPVSRSFPKALLDELKREK